MRYCTFLSCLAVSIAAAPAAHAGFIYDNVSAGVMITTNKETTTQGGGSSTPSPRTVSGYADGYRPGFPPGIGSPTRISATLAWTFLDSGGELGQLDYDEGGEYGASIMANWFYEFKTSEPATVWMAYSTSTGTPLATIAFDNHSPGLGVTSFSIVAGQHRLTVDRFAFLSDPAWHNSSRLEWTIVVPEPASYLLARLAALGGVLFAVRRILMRKQHLT